MEQTDYLQKASEWLTLAQPLFWGVAVWGWWSIKKIFVRQEDCSACRDEIVKQITDLESKESERRIAQKFLESALAALPTKADLQAIALSMKEMEGSFNTLNEKVDGQGRAMSRMEKSVDLLTEVHMENRT